MKKNLLFLMVDQMHGQVLDNGNPCITPNLDKLSKRGVKFNSCLLYTSPSPRD